MARNTVTGNRTHQSGLVLLMILLFIFVSSLAASSMVRIYTTEKQREAEEELLYCGDQYRRAIAEYYNSFPAGSVRQYPKTLNDLLLDNRFPTPMRRIRKLCVDPMTGLADWELVMTNGGISGVHSKSAKEPYKKANFPKKYSKFASASTYADWIFDANEQKPQSQ